MRNCTYFGFAQKLKGTIKIRKAGKQEKSILYFPSFLLSSFLMFCYRSRVLGKATYFYSCFGMMITLLALVITASAQEVKDKESLKKRPSANSVRDLPKPTQSPS
jgi:membrane protein CcdC involved in cytochrome C biogenesis